ncbi:MAG: PfkB family carbohydrate kinase, partial [Cetobacterium sp.]
MKKSRLEEILNSFENLKVAVVGDMMLDDYLIGTVERISPEAPVPVVSVKEERFVLGGAANVVNNLSTLGAKAVCFGVIGEDFDGDRLINELEKKLIETSGVVRSSKRPTIVKRRIIGGNQQLLRLDWEDARPISADLEASLIKQIEAKLDNLNAVILSDYDKGVLTPKVVKRIIELCREKG